MVKLSKNEKITLKCIATRHKKQLPQPNKLYYTIRNNNNEINHGSKNKNILVSPFKNSM